MTAEDVWIVIGAIAMTILVLQVLLFLSDRFDDK